MYLIRMQFKNKAVSHLNNALTPKGKEVGKLLIQIKEKNKRKKKTRPKCFKKKKRIYMSRIQYHNHK